MTRSPARRAAQMRASRSELSQYMIEQAKQRGLPPKVWERMTRLTTAVPAKAQEVGGHMGKAAHLSGYTWEGVAFSMLFDMIGYLFKTLILPPHLKESMVYNNLDDDLKYQADESGKYPTIYRPVIEGDKVRLTDEVVDPKKVTEGMIWANGYMPEPNQEMGLRNRYQEWMDSMMGSSGFNDPIMSRVFNQIPRPEHFSPSAKSGLNSVAQLNFMQGR